MSDRFLGDHFGEFDLLGRGPPLLSQTVGPNRIAIYRQGDLYVYSVESPGGGHGADVSGAVEQIGLRRSRALLGLLPARATGAEIVLAEDRVDTAEAEGGTWLAVIPYGPGGRRFPRPGQGLRRRGVLRAIHTGGRPPR